MDRIKLFFIFESSQRPRSAPHAALPIHRVHLFTLIQLALLALCWAVKLSPFGLAFPVVIAALVPFRRLALTKVFTHDELSKLDSSDY